MSKPVPRRQEAIQQQKQVAPASAGREPADSPEPSASAAPLFWGWRFVFTLWASAFGFMLAYEMFKTVQSLIRWYGSS
jgi:hypothetical protein